jgi:hypothetical protein
VIVKPDPIPEFPEPEDQAPPVVFVKAVPVIITAFELSDAYPAAISTTVLGLVPSLDKVNPFIYPFTSLEPPPDGVDHVPSPRQKVDEEADEPLLRFPTAKFPVTPVESGNPVAFVKTTLAGVPNAGVVSVGDVRVLFVRVCVSVVPTIVPAGAVREVPQADPVDTTIPAPGYV